MKRVWAPVAVALIIVAPRAGLASGTVVRSVRLSPGGGAVAVIVKADGPLPLPAVGVLGGPPRIYLDFRDVTTATTGIQLEGHALVRRVRVALNQAQPPVTRVVIDLARAAPYRVEAGGRERGELTVVIDAPAGVQSAPPSPQIAAPQTPAQATPPNLRRESAAPPVTTAPAARPPAAPPSPPASSTLSRTPGPGASGTVVRSVRLAPGGGAAAIIVRADGPLPSPAVGVLGGPPRIYLDFRDVTTATTGIQLEGHALVRRVRVALNQAQPPVTRVVIDLARAAPYRVEAGGRERGELTVVIDAPAGVQSAPPSPQIAAPQTPAQATPPNLRRESAAPPVTTAPAARPPAAPPSPPASSTLSRTPGPGASGTVVRSVRLAPGGGAAAIIVRADGPLPSPAVGVLGGPPRIYLDFRDVTTATTGIQLEGHALVRRVRVALNQAQPPVTRVVIDLARAAPYRVEAGGRERGELTVVVEAPAATELAPAVPGAQAVSSPAPLSPEPAPARVATVTPPAAASKDVAARAPAKDVERYLAQISSALDRLEQLRPLLASLDALKSVSGVELKAAAGEFQSIRQALVAIEPPRTLKATHELFCTVCALGALSATTRLESVARGDVAGAWNAASAAASALMLLDRSGAELGVVPIRSPESQ
jgi:hypothetical protein